MHEVQLDYFLCQMSKTKCGHNFCLRLCEVLHNKMYLKYMNANWPISTHQLLVEHFEKILKISEQILFYSPLGLWSHHYSSLDLLLMQNIFTGFPNTSPESCLAILRGPKLARQGSECNTNEPSQASTWRPTPQPFFTLHPLSWPSSNHLSAFPILLCWLALNYI